MKTTIQIIQSKRSSLISRIFILLFPLFFIAGVASAQTGLVINPDGGENAEGTDGIKIVVSPTGNIMLFKYNWKQKWPSAQWDGNPNNSSWNDGMLLRFRFHKPGEAVNNGDRAMTFCSKTDISGTGVVGDPYTLRLQGVVNSTISGKAFYVTIVISYIYPNNYYIADYYVRAPFDLTEPEEVHLYMYQDDYIIDGSGRTSPNPDHGFGFVGPLVSGSSYDLVGNQNIYGTHSIKMDDAIQSFYVGSPHYSGGNQPVTDLYYNNYVGGQGDIDICIHFSTPALGAGEMAVRRMLRGITAPNTPNTFVSTPVVAPTVSPDPSSPVAVNFVSTSVSEAEGDVDHIAEGIKIRVEGGNLVNPQVLTFYIKGGTAAQNTDYTYLDGFTIPAGNYATVKEFIIPNFTIKGNEIAQSNRTISIGMRANCNDLIGIGPTNTCNYTIVDDDSYAANIEAVDNTIEGDSASGRFRIWFTNTSLGNINTSVPKDVTLTFSNDGSTASDADYAWVTPNISSNQIHIPAGTSELFIEFIAHEDFLLEGEEMVVVTLTAASPSTLAISSMPVKAIIADATDGTIIVKRVSDASESSTDGLFQVCFKDGRVTAEHNDVTITYTIDGTAVAGVDYEALPSNTAILLRGDNCVDIPVKVKDNYIVQGEREISLTLTHVELQ